MSRIEIVLENTDQLSTLAGVLGGLVFAVAIPMLMVPRNRRRRGHCFLLFLSLNAAASFVASAFLATFTTIPGNTLLMEAGLRGLELELPDFIMQVVILSALCCFAGLISLLAAIGLSGWLYSRFFGICSMVIAIVAMTITVGGFALIMTGFNEQMEVIMQTQIPQ